MSNRGQPNTAVGNGDRVIGPFGKPGGNCDIFDGWHRGPIGYIDSHGVEHWYTASKTYEYKNLHTHRHSARCAYVRVLIRRWLRALWAHLVALSRGAWVSMRKGH